MILTQKEEQLILHLRKAQSVQEETYFLVHLIPIGEEGFIQQNLMLKQKTLSVDPAIKAVVQQVKRGLAATQALFLITNDEGFLRTFG